MDFNNIRKEVKPGMYGDDVSAAKLELELTKLIQQVADIRESTINLGKNLKQLALTCKELTGLSNDVNEAHMTLIRELKHDVNDIKCRLGIVEDNNYEKNNTSDNE